MNAINHQLTTGAAYAIAYNSGLPLFSFMSLPEGITLAMVGALLPDIDCRTSRIGRLVPFLSIPIQNLLGHRGAFHSLLAAALLLYSTVEIIGENWAYSLTFGYVMHLIGDSCTKAGVNYFWPLTTRYRFPILIARNPTFEYITSMSMLVIAYISFL
ncbi:metal-dependent hydrolase (plasmid) [Vibrio sp. SS-MA-C1-2]|uniref:metal-dependent hydrolase n=1 Tax=Vibrio sp. SS-MA-C1-2 TaxID=2908646 RepID=UPI001F36E074|nr:metal-dependent hydrolase [Vibrio sp. SS-MA-C1-2]UJF20260.1 metal-dependent hydrolase [Vibrio sp. SS-MA-C1-2]